MGCRSFRLSWVRVRQLMSLSSSRPLAASCPVCSVWSLPVLSLLDTAPRSLSRSFLSFALLCSLLTLCFARWSFVRRGLVVPFGFVACATLALRLLGLLFCVCSAFLCTLLVRAIVYSPCVCARSPSSSGVLLAVGLLVCSSRVVGGSLSSGMP